jgi:hypothetical protein
MTAQPFCIGKRSKKDDAVTNDPDVGFELLDLFVTDVFLRQRKRKGFEIAQIDRKFHFCLSFDGRVQVRRFLNAIISVPSIPRSYRFY